MRLLSTLILTAALVAVPAASSTAAVTSAPVRAPQLVRAHPVGSVHSEATTPRTGSCLICWRVD